MKKLSLLLSASLILAACGEQTGLKDLQKIEGELQNEIQKLNDSLERIQGKILVLKNDTDTGTDETLPQVRLETITPGEFRHTVSIQGIISTDNNIMLAAENGGKVLKVYVKEGQTVTKGQRLVDLDGSVIEANLAEIRTRLTLAKETYEKQDRLYKRQIGTQMQMLQAENNYKALQNQEATLTTQLDKYQLRSPINGIVDAINVNLGEITGPGAPVVRVVNLTELEVTADVSEKYVGAFKQGDQVRVYFPALKDTLVAKITALGQVINTNNRTFSMNVAIQSKDNRLKPNLLAIIEATDFLAPDGISVPSNLVQTEGYDKFIMVAVKDGSAYKVEKRAVTTGLSSAGSIFIQAGLEAGDLVIVEGHLNVESGDNVQPQ